MPRLPPVDMSPQARLLARLSCGDTYSAHQSREHDDCNVLCLGARVTGVELALDIVRSFVAAKFTGEERHRRRLAKIAELENLD